MPLFPLTLSQLEQYLSKAAWILKGPVDASDFKVYIFPLLFFKRLCDVYDEERARALAESDGDEEYADLPEMHRFAIPAGCHWRDVRATTSDVGAAIARALRCIESANPDQLFGIFGDAQWGNKDKLPDRLLTDLVEHFSKYTLSNERVAPDMLGQAYEYLIKHFADLTNKKAGEFYTPREVVHLMGLLLDPQEGERIYDPACGTGGMLLECVEHVRAEGGEYRTLRLYGQEKNLTSSSIARMNMFLHGIEDFRIEREDTLRKPLFKEGDVLDRFDCVIANPPFSLKDWGVAAWSADAYGRNAFGTPPKTNADMAWVQHMVASMAPDTGRTVVVLPHGTLFRKGAEGRIRRKLIEADLIEAVIGLAPNVFYGTQLAPAILVLRHRKREGLRQNILFIDAAEEFRAGRAQNYLDPVHVRRIYDWYAAAEDVDDYVHLATAEEIAANEYNLNIPLYVEKAIADDLPTVAEAKAALAERWAAAQAAEAELERLLRGFARGVV